MRTRRRFVRQATGALAGFGIAGSTASGAVFQYKLGHDVPESHPIGVGAAEFAAAVKRESGGRLEIQVFPNSSLGNEASMITQLRIGALQMSIMGSGPLAAISPISNLSYIAYAFSGGREAYAALDGDVGTLIRKEFDAKGIATFPKSWASGLRQMTTAARPIRSVDDLSGLRMMASPSPVMADMYRAFGASPVATGAGEFYTVLATHLVDGADAGPFSNILAFRMYEVQKYVTVTNHMWTAFWTIMNAGALRALPDDLQTIVERNIDAVVIRQRRIVEAQNAAIADWLARYGMRSNPVSDVKPFRTRLAGYYARWKEDLGPAAWATLERYSGKLGS